MRVGLRERLSGIWELTQELSWPTRAILAAYGLYVPASWIVAVAPGEIAYQGAQTVELDAPWGRVTTLLRVDDQLVVLGVEGRHEEPDLLVVDLARFDPQRPSSGIVARVDNAGTPHSGQRADGRLHVLTSTSARTRRAVTVQLGDGTASMEDVLPTSLWILPDGTTVDYDLTDYLVNASYPGHIANVPAHVSGSLALVRAAEPGGKTDEHGAWIERPPLSDDDFYLLDSSSTEPLGQFETVALGDITVHPGLDGFVYTEQGSSSVAWCPEEACEWGSLHVRTDHGFAEHVDVRSDIHRVAVCTKTELYLYGGDPPSDEIVFLGRTQLPGCSALAILGELRVLVLGPEGAAWLVTFTEEAS